MKNAALRRLGVLMMIVASAVLIGFRGGAASYALFWTSLTVPAAALIYGVVIRTLFHAYFTVSGAEPLRGEAVECRIVLKNSSPLPLPDIRVRLEPGKLDYAPERTYFTLSLGPGETRAIELRPRCLHCGETETGLGEVRVGDIFGLTERTLSDTVKLTILPRRRRAENLAQLRRLDEENRAPIRSYFGERVPDGRLRAYSPGDDVRYINWKASQLAGRPMMRNTSPEPKGEPVLIPDSRASLPEGLAGWLCEDAVEEGAVVLTDWFSRHGVPLRVVGANGEVDVRDEGDVQAVYNAVSSGWFTGTARPDQLMERSMAPERRYILMTWELDAAFMTRARRCLDNGAEITVIYLGDAAQARAAMSSERRIGFLSVGPGEDILEVLSGGGGEK